MESKQLSLNDKFCLYISEKQLSEPDILDLIHEYMKHCNCLNIRIVRTEGMV